MKILDEILGERIKQDVRWGEQNHPFTTLEAGQAKGIADYLRHVCDQSAISGTTNWLEILEEEVYEAIAEAAAGDKEKFREELIQVAAVVVAMIECLDRNGL